METDVLAALLDAVRAGDLSTESALEALRSFPFESVGDFAKLDTHRALRTGLAEAVFCLGKSEQQVAEIVQRLAAISDHVIATRATPRQFRATLKLISGAKYHEAARMITVGEAPEPHDPNRYVAVLTAGTADISVAEEAALTLQFAGSRVERCYDVGVAGLHRLLDNLDLLQNANVLVVCAGMEGALASVVGGLVARPVVAVPTSIGYGASFGGVAALLSMLNSCSGGVAVVNIDNGFGAGVYAHRINSG